MLRDLLLQLPHLGLDGCQLLKGGGQIKFLRGEFPVNLPQQPPGLLKIFGHLHRKMPAVDDPTDHLCIDGGVPHGNVQIHLVQRILPAVPPITAAHISACIRLERLILQHDSNRHFPSQKALLAQVGQLDVGFGLLPGILSDQPLGKGLALHPRGTGPDLLGVAASGNIDVDMGHTMISQLLKIGIRVPGRAGILPKLVAGPPAYQDAPAQQMTHFMKDPRQLQQNGIAAAVVRHPSAVAVIVAVHQHEILLGALDECHGDGCLCGSGLRPGRHSHPDRALLHRFQNSLAGGPGAVDTGQLRQVPVLRRGRAIVIGCSKIVRALPRTVVHPDHTDCPGGGGLQHHVAAVDLGQDKLPCRAPEALRLLLIGQSLLFAQRIIKDLSLQIGHIFGEPTGDHVEFRLLGRKHLQACVHRTAHVSGKPQPPVRNTVLLQLLEQVVSCLLCVRGPGCPMQRTEPPGCLPQVALSNPQRDLFKQLQRSSRLPVVHLTAQIKRLLFYYFCRPVICSLSPRNGCLNRIHRKCVTPVQAVSAP